MLRIHGRIGDWPVDLTLELDNEDWARLATHLATTHQPASESAAEQNQTDSLWQVTQELLRNAGQMEGPALLAELEALAGSAAAGKRLLVRLRHSPRVKLEHGVDAPIYRWQG